MRVALSLFAAAVVALGSVSAVVAQDDDPVAKRIAIMKENGRQMGQLVPMTRGQKEFDAEIVKAALAKLAEDAAAFDPETLFPEGSDMDPETTASPKIWEDMEGFKAAAEKFKADTAEAAANPPADLDALGPVMGKIGQNCGACHEVYRVKKG